MAPLDDNDRAMIAKYEAKLAPALAEVLKWKKAINTVCEAADEAALYDLVNDEPGSARPTSRKVYGRAEFFGKPLASVVTRILEDHTALDIDELYGLMFSGGFGFGATEEKAKNNLKISLGKNSKFGKTPQGHYVIAPPGTRKKASGDEKEAADEEGAPDVTPPATEEVAS